MSSKPTVTVDNRGIAVGRGAVGTAVDTGCSPLCQSWVLQQIGAGGGGGSNTTMANQIATLQNQVASLNTTVGQLQSQITAITPQLNNLQPANVRKFVADPQYEHYAPPAPSPPTQWSSWYWRIGAQGLWLWDGSVWRGVNSNSGEGHDPGDYVGPE